MRIKRHRVIPITSSDSSLEAALAQSLNNAGENVTGAGIIVNYHEAYFPIAGYDGRTVASAWKLTIVDNQFVMAGGREDQLDSAAARQYSHPGVDFLDALDPNAANRNDDWRMHSRANAVKASTSFARGAVIRQKNPEIIVTTDNKTKMDMLVITDGQRGKLNHQDGRQCYIPKTFRAIAEVVPGNYININYRTVPEEQDRKLAASLMVADIANRYPGKFIHGFTAHSKQSSKRSDHHCLMIKAGDEMLGSIAGDDTIKAALDSMAAVNINNGFTESPVTDSGSLDYITLNSQKIDVAAEALKTAEAEYSSENDLAPS